MYALIYTDASSVQLSERDGYMLYHLDYFHLLNLLACVAGLAGSNSLPNQLLRICPRNIAPKPKTAPFGTALRHGRPQEAVAPRGRRGGREAAHDAELVLASGFQQRFSWPRGETT